MLPCRLTTQLITGLTVAQGTINNNEATTLNSSSLQQTAQISYGSNLTYSTEITTLITEAFWFDANQGNFLASAFKTQGGNQNPADTDFNTLVSQIQQLQNNLFNGTPPTGLSFSGNIPCQIGITDWKTPWLPLMLEWSVNYLPIENIPNPINNTNTVNYDSNFIQNNFQLSTDQTDLDYTGSLPQSIQEYSNLILLTPGASQQLEQQINNYLQLNPNPQDQDQLNTILNTLQEQPILSQALGGLNQGLLMHQQVMQMQPKDPVSSDQNLCVFSNISVPDGVGNQNRTAPLPENSYNPIRAGYLQLNQLNLIDAFGGTLKIDISNPVIAQSLVNKNTSNIYLAPRITQPSRLLFRWLSASNDEVEMNSHPATSPICGWVIFNNLERGLAFYNSQGVALGSLIVSGAGDSIIWQGAPGNNQTYGQSIETVFANENSHLKNLALGIYNNGASFLSAMLKATDDSLSTIFPQNSQQDPSLALLMSRPLAVVRVGLKLDLKGLPAYNQSWDVLNTAISSPNSTNPIERSTSNFEKVEFPVMLGDLTNINDGFIGYFSSGADGSTDYSKFYTLSSDDSDANVVQLDWSNTLTLNSDRNSTMTYLTMLVDPTAKIHGTTGILPTKAIEIPPEQYSTALKSLALTFLTSPILSPTSSEPFPIPIDINQNWSLIENPVTFPIPKEGNGKWSWVEKQANQWQTQPISKATEQATLSYTNQKLSEGWLKYQPNSSTSSNSSPS